MIMLESSRSATTTNDQIKMLGHKCIVRRELKNVSKQISTGSLRC